MDSSVSTRIRGLTTTCNEHLDRVGGLFQTLILVLDFRSAGTSQKSVNSIDARGTFSKQIVDFFDGFSHVKQVLKEFLSHLYHRKLNYETTFWSSFSSKVCFQDTILVWIPVVYVSLILLAFTFWKWHQYRQSKQSQNKEDLEFLDSSVANSSWLNDCPEDSEQLTEISSIGSQFGVNSSNCLGCCCLWGLWRLFRFVTAGNIRICFSFLLIMTCLAELGFIWLANLEANLDAGKLALSLIPTLLKTILYALLLIAHWLDFQPSLFALVSYSMPLFWFICLLQSVISIRSRGLLYHNLGYVIIRLCGNFSILVQFVLSLFCGQPLSDVQLRCGQNDSINPRPFTSVLSDLTFSWVNQMVWSGFRRPLIIDKLWSLQVFNKVVTNAHKFAPRLKMTRKLKQLGAYQTTVFECSNLILALAATFWRSLLFTSFLKLLVSFLPYLNTLFMSWLLDFIQHSDHSGEPSWHGYFYVLLMILTPMTESFINGLCEMETGEISLRIKSCITDSIYRKTLRLSTSGREHFTMGEIANLMSIDTLRISHFFLVLNDFWSTPLQFAVALYLLWIQLGWASLASLVSIMALLPLNSLITSRMRQLTALIMKAKDKRTRLMSEILSGIKVIKLHAWEGLFAEQIRLIRNEELSKLKSRLVYQSVLVFIFNAAPVLVTVSSFSAYILLDSVNRLTAQRAFVSLALFNQIRVPLNNTPKLIAEYSTFVVSLKRITKFMKFDELDPNSVCKLFKTKENSIDLETRFDVVVENGSFSWSSQLEIEEQQLRVEEFKMNDKFKPIKANLEQIDLKIPKGKLVAIVGQVGSGKTTLLNALLGNLHKLQGKVMIHDSISYVAQQAWIQNATLRDNILYLNPMDEKKFAHIIEACALGPDIAVLSGGVETEIGEKGINVSGGQKQRIAIARACYAGGSLFLFDDPLSALDAHVGRHIFDQIIGPNGLLNQTTRVLVTHRLSELPDCDFIYVLKNGRIAESGTYQQLMQRTDGEFAEFLQQQQLKQVCVQQLSIIKTLNKTINQTSQSQNNIKNSCLISDEKSTTVPKVEWSHYYVYMRQLGLLNVTLMLFLFMICALLNISSSAWLAHWSNINEQRQLFNMTGNSPDNLYLLFVYIILNAILCGLILIATLIVYLVTLRGARTLHDQMLTRILQAPLMYFERNPMGRILNRFTKDLEICDVVLGTSIRTALLQFSRLLAAFIIIAIKVPCLIAVIVLGTIFYCAIQKVYIASSRQLRRIESVTRSPIYSHFSETISGASTIRVFGKVDKFVSELHRRIDINNQASFAALAINRWMSIRLEFLGYMVVFANALYLLIMRNEVDASTAGLTLSYSLTITRYLNYYILAASNLETNIVSVERCLEYTDTPVETEYCKTSPLHSVVSSTKQVSGDWPSRGEIRFEDYSTRYRPGLGLVLNRLNFAIQSNHRVGVVGRTGAGKSSLTLALFRILEGVEGRILIDGQDIGKLPLFDLRSRLAIIPQDPVLFTGTLRYNLDPFGGHDDNELWSALELTSLKSFVESLKLGLDHQISEGGENLSAGQKQLLCLARALVRRSKVLIMDEATAAVDIETDELIQQTIRSQFIDCTILTIAHRINTIIDYDRVLVLDQGTIAEFDLPHNLLANPLSIFRSMATEAGLSFSIDRFKPP